MKPRKDTEELEFILLSERSQSEKDASSMIPTIGHSGKEKTIEKVKISVVAMGWGGERGMYRRSIEDL